MKDFFNMQDMHIKLTRMQYTNIARGPITKSRREWLTKDVRLLIKSMKIFILFFLISSKIFAADLSAETVKNIKCYFYDDPNENPIMMLYFTGDNNKLELIVDQAENSSDEALVNTIFQNEVKVEEVNGKIVVTAEGLLLEMKTPIAYWSHGESRDSMLTLKSFDLATHLVCEQQ